jgi:hypothetical protein
VRQNKGWIKLHRSTLDNPVVMKSAAHFAVWCLLLLLANSSPSLVIFNGKKITLQPGQLITGRKDLSNKLHNDFNEYKVERILNDLENAQQIEQRKTPNGRLITLLNWGKFQKVNNKMHNECTTTAQRLHNETTLNKNIKNIENIERMKEDTSFTQSLDASFLDSDDSDQLKVKGGKLGQGVVMLSDKQDDYLLEHLSIDEYDKYISIVAEQELKGNSYKKKTHFQAIIEMVNHDRQVAQKKGV